MKKFNVVLPALTLAVAIGMLCMMSTVGLADGRFTRGQKWEPFLVEKEEADFYVAPNGNDSWSGTLPSPNEDKTDGPFATIERAMEAVRNLKQQVYVEKEVPVEKRYIGSPHKYGKGKDILVLIRGGYYTLEKPLQFGPEDGGERCETNKPSGAFEFNLLKDYFVTYAAYPGETPIISGGKRITNWLKVSDRKWVTYVKGMQINNLFANGKPQTLARTPNEGYFKTAEMPATTTEFKFHEGDIKKWPNMENNRIHFLLRWHEGINCIKEIDEENNVAYLSKPEPGIIVVPPRYYVENVEALLDAPGEWFFDKDTGKLSYIPEEGIDDPNKANICTPAIPQLVVVKGEPDKPVRNLRFYGLTFQITKPGSNMISFEYAKNCELVSSKISSAGGNAIYIGKGCYQTRILKNTIDGADKGGIGIAGDPHPKWADLIDGTIVSYNHISNCGGTSIYARNTLNTTISHNEITNTRGRFALYVGGWSNIERTIDGGYRVEYNHIHHVLAGADDSGAITTSGETRDSIIKNNLIHDVRPGFFNENVAFWFDNWSKGWTVEDNIYYNLEQAPMKLCAANLEPDNVYRDNFLIETPENEPEEIIEGEPELEYSDLKIERAEASKEVGIHTGELVKISATVKNTGATGIKNVLLYVDGKVVDSKKFPIISNNSRVIEFDMRFYDPGEHSFAIGDLGPASSTPPKTVKVIGKKVYFLYTNLNVEEAIERSPLHDPYKPELPQQIIPAGEEVVVSANIENVRDYENTADVKLYIDGKVVESKSITLSPKESKEVSFTIKPEKGIHKIGIGDLAPMTVKIYPHHSIDIAKSDLHTYVSGTAKPGKFVVDKAHNHFEITVAGTDFLHAEDSYGSIYLKDIKGNFVATVKVVKYGEGVNDWYRAGLFVRNDISKSYETEPGSKGEVLMFTTPKLAMIHWDRYGDGCMHQVGSREKRVHEKENPFPLWIRLERRGDTFVGFISYDGKDWIKPRYAAPIAGIADTVDVGIAAGTIDQRPSLVILEDFKLEVEDIGWEEG